VRKQIFKLLFLHLFFLLVINTVLKSSDILQAYDLNKSNLRESSILETEKYLYTVAVSKKNKILDVSIKKNQLKAEIKLLDRIKNKVDWPSDFPPYLKEAIWKYYKSSKQFKIEGIKLIDKGEIGDNYFVVVGAKKTNIDKFIVSYNVIKEELK
tara:strand:- start:1073 stop:1534 length:462 start_codon:yes stop_codon:yes gene_type:complete